jgi:hypothetical protein
MADLKGVVQRRGETGPKAATGHDTHEGIHVGEVVQDLWRSFSMVVDANGWTACVDDRSNIRR